MSILNRKFENPEDLLSYLRQQCEEEDAIEKVMARRPLRENDQLFRSTFVLDGVAHWYSVVRRSDGSIEFWVKHYIDSNEPFDDKELAEIRNVLPDFDPELDCVCSVDRAIHDTTHVGFTLAISLSPEPAE